MKIFMQKASIGRLFCLIIIIPMVLFGCASPATVEIIKTVEVEKEVITTVEVQVEGAPGETIIVTATPIRVEPMEPEAPADEATQPTIKPPTVFSTPILPNPTSVLPTPTPLPQLPSITSPTPVSIDEKRSLEIEWPPIMRLGESDVIRLALIPHKQGYIATVEYPDHQVVTQTVNIPRPGGYDLFASARLDGVGFEIAPTGDQSQYLSPDQDLFWRWSLTPRHNGRQRLLIQLTLRWIPISTSSGPQREVIAHSQGLEIQVISFLGLSQSQALFAGLIGLIFGGSLSLAALVFVRPKSLRRALQIQSPNPDLIIEMPPGITLVDQEQRLLQSLFKVYSRLLIKNEFLSGYSGARTFLALPIHPDERSDAYTIAKLGERQSILAEFENYETFVKDRLPPITARIQQPPVITNLPTRGLRLAALQYTFIGEPGSTPTSLRQALLEDPDPSLLQKLFDTFGPNWWMQRRPYSFRLGQEYDRLLPTHLVLEPASGRGDHLDGRLPPAEIKLRIGDLVTMRHMPTSELRADGKSQSLLGTGSAGHPQLRVRWLSLDRPEGATGRIVATRQSLLKQYAAGCDLLGLPDPLPRIPEFLSKLVNGGRSTIHGDLNLENILLGPGELVWLIDFAQTREGHTLYDFAHLEAEIIAHVLAPNIHAPSDYITMLRSPQNSPYAHLFALREAIHTIASRCLFNPSQPREYHLALTLACLGALKFTNLNQHAKHMLFLSAAYLAKDI